MKFKYTTYLILLFSISLAFISSEMNAQRFDAKVIVGLNASQIDGDDLAGYTKLGFGGGLGVSYNLNNPWDITLELLYSQRGSQSHWSSSPDEIFEKIHLEYLELPLIVSYQDWYIASENYFRVSADLGLTYGYLIHASNNHHDLGVEHFLDHDVGFLIGANYYLTKNLGLGGRFTRSFTRMYKYLDGGKSFLGYFFSFRFYYDF